jgi:PKD repeat protein
MKNTLLIIITLALITNACEFSNYPTARFDVSKTFVSTGADVYFYNNSTHADEYEWDFGDGSISNEIEPTHQYQYPGIYKVKLSAYYKDQVDNYYMTIEVADPDLNIQVREYTGNYVVAGVEVILYPTLDDWDNQTHAIKRGITDNDGIIEFYYLPEGFYYMDIANSSYNNYDLADDDIRYIQTPYIAGSTTYITAFVDYVGATKSAKLDRKIVPIVTSRRPFDPKRSERIIK